MLVKLIVCRVPGEGRRAFSEAQSHWSGIAGAPGFFGQTGGWTVDGRAVIVGFWRNAQVYERFMHTSHDSIAHEQRETYAAIDVTLAEECFAIPGPARDITNAIKGARFVRIADCAVRADRIGPLP